MGGADGGATQAAWLAGTAWWLGRPGWRSTKHPRAAQLESARARRRWATCLVATCTRGSVSCECATHCAASHAASRRGSCQSPLVGGHHPRLLARTGTPASPQLEGGCVPPLHYGGKSFLRPFPPVGGRMPRPKPERARQAQGVRQPSTLRARYGPRWIGQGRQATLGESPVSVRRPPRQTRRRRGRPARSPIRRRRGLGRSHLCRAAAPCGARGWPAARHT